MPEHKKKAQLRVGRVVVCAVILTIVIAGIVFGITRLIPNCNGSSQSGEDVTETFGPEETTAEGEYLELNQDHCTAYVGTVIKLVCSANPQSLLDSVTYSTTDEKILTVTDNGQVEVVGIGTAAVIAVSGPYSDTVIIRGIDKNSEETTEYPMVEDTNTKSADSGENTNGTDSDGKNNDDQNNDGEKDDSVKQESGSDDGRTDKENPSTDSGQETAAGDTDAQDGQPAQTEDVEPTTDSADASPAEDCREAVSEAAESLGFTYYAGGTYVYREDGNYLGEIITDEDKLQIYLQTRTSTFDPAIKDLLKTVLPNSYETAFAELIGATEVKTLTLDGHMVRIVVSEDSSEGHKQLIVYY